MVNPYDSAAVAIILSHSSHSAAEEQEGQQAVGLQSIGRRQVLPHRVPRDVHLLQPHVLDHLPARQRQSGRRSGAVRQEVRRAVGLALRPTAGRPAAAAGLHSDPPSVDCPTLQPDR